jgi:NADH dehydrogenase [ubiquinone] 1 alpha subcomplex assembly factor 5
MTDTNEIQVFNSALIAGRRMRFFKSNPAEHDFLFRWTFDQMVDRLRDINRDFPLCLKIGARGTLPAISSIGKTITTNSFAINSEICADAEFLPFAPGTFDLTLSALDFHTINDLPGTLIQIRQSLKPDGLLMAAMAGDDTLMELKDSLMRAELEIKGGVSPRIFPFADKRQMGALLQRAGYALPVVDSERVTVTYKTMFDLIRDLRAMGETNALLRRNKSWPGRELFLRAAEHYAQNHADPDGRIRATFNIIFITGWAPHESQQKPLKPGSAKTRLADALDAREIKTGDIAVP